VLVVDDEPQILRALRINLRARRYEVTTAANGTQALDEAAAHPPDLVILDLGLPDMDGVDVIGGLRGWTAVPIIVLSGRADSTDKVEALDAGADDYVTKPFRLAELLARTRAHLRRAEPAGPTERLAVGRLELDMGAHRTWIAGREVDLRPKEFDLLALLMLEAGRVVGRERIMAEVWDEHWFGSTKTLDMHISALRRKLLDAGDVPNRLSTIRGVGYRLEQL
jgi:two-component system KDP operon response regulator KdpE